MNGTKKTNQRVSELVADCKEFLQDNFSEAKLKQSYIILKEAKARGLLGATKRRDCCLADTINAANEILRIYRFDSELTAALKSPDTLYTYIGLVAINCITA